MQNNKKIQLLFLPKYTAAGASSRYRMYQYLPFLENENCRCVISQLFSDEYIKQFNDGTKPNFFKLFLAYLQRLFVLFSVRKYDLIIIQYELFPYIPFKIEYWLKKMGINYLIDFDDAVFHNYDSLKPKFIIPWYKSKFKKAIENANWVVTGSPYLTTFCEQYSNKVVEIPTVVNLSNYPLIETDNSEFIIGWIGSKSTSKYIVDILPALKEFSQNHQCKVHLIGFDKQINIVEKLSNAILIEWNSNTEAEEISKFTVGIMPLRDNNWENGKCGFKLIQYMACGKPTISTPLLANKKIDRNETSLFADTQQQWIEALNQVLSNEEKYKNIGIENRKIIASEYSITANFPKLLKLIKNT